jgi:hypothetical protein
MQNKERFIVKDGLVTKDGVSSFEEAIKNEKPVKGKVRFRVFNEKGEPETDFFKENIVVLNGRYLLLQRLTGVAGNVDYTNHTVRHVAFGDGASSGLNVPPKAPQETDTDLYHKIAPFSTDAAVDGIYYPVTEVVYENQTTVRFTTIVTPDKLAEQKGYAINEAGLFASTPDNSNWVLFAHITFDNTSLAPNRTYILDWYIILDNEA